VERAISVGGRVRGGVEVRGVKEEDLTDAPSDVISFVFDPCVVPCVKWSPRRPLTILGPRTIPEKGGAKQGGSQKCLSHVAHEAQKVRTSSSENRVQCRKTIRKLTFAK